MCLFILTQTTAVFATSVSDLYGIKYTGDTEWKEEDKNKGKTPQSSTITPVIGSYSDIKLNVNGNNVVTAQAFTILFIKSLSINYLIF